MTRYIPLNRPESASHKNPETLLATGIYNKLEEFIQAAASTAEDETDDERLHSSRRHNTVLIHGARGMGKSSVLVNLETALKGNDSMLRKIHILKPVDPTLLEADDDLFLNVIVAAVLSDTKVIEAQERKSQHRQGLQRTLQNLGQKLESMQSQRSERGLDKIRSFIGNHQLIEEVHRFFEAVLKLLDKKLLVLTIDDVDTSLNRAFENLEVVRRYLTTPYVLPILSGDLDLYHEVTWRDFHGRLMKETTYQKREAFDRAHTLAVEYQRKVLPFQYRLSMPSVVDYLSNPNIELGEPKGENNLALPHFHAWLEGLLNGPVNGLENSYLAVPLPSLRALAQLAFRLKHRIPKLAKGLNRDWSGLQVRRAILMPASSFSALDDFQQAYRQGESNTRAYSHFYTSVNEQRQDAHDDSPPLREMADAWHEDLIDHFRTERDAGAAYMVMLTHQHWRSSSTDNETWRSVFDTPLFQPLRHDAPGFPSFDRGADLSDWREKLKGRAPESWLMRLPERAIIPYPVPEAGRVTTVNMESSIDDDREGEVRLLLDLVLHRNFYSASQRGSLACTGRVIELVVTSLIRNVNERDIAIIMQRPPFYSFSQFAQTKTLSALHSDESDDNNPIDDNEPLSHGATSAIEKLANDINLWRNRHSLTKWQLSPWLIYNVINKVINQAWIFNRPLGNNQQPKPLHVTSVLWVARQTFYSLWAAFGSFEKGPIFGFPEIVANVNIGDGQLFENSLLHQQNIAPFYGPGRASKKRYGTYVHAFTAVFEDHPLRFLLDTYSAPPLSADGDARSWIKQKLKLRHIAQNEVRSFTTAMKRFPGDASEIDELLQEFDYQFENEQALSRSLLTAFRDAFPDYNKR
ncbi:antiviral RADAR system adenosine triphosphatase RdrA [Burkholderia ubonensis]|uniref:antiviral RADAR system adenosine triphosphatase RdrA n=1 Tax=Burkholderia ubonensis TaxID=101571 RepID=UPI0012FCD22A|nr:antiviral RADAR system adenosine triphosphatase RdrA [Burkholderia ubonensis]